MPMATSTMVPLEEYLHTSYEHDCEWVDGVLKERGVPDEYHSMIQFFFAEYFGRLKQDLKVRVRTKLRIRVAQRNYRIPDVALLRLDTPFGPIPTVPPLLCIEILSPDDRMSDLQQKIADYVSMGVGAIWVVDPRKRTLAVADANGIHQVEELTLQGTNVKLTAAEIFAELDQLEAL
jgi:Uma2 family endonuclease